MKPKYHGYFCPEAYRSFREWLFLYWHDFYVAHGGCGVVEERGIQVLGCYFIWQRVSDS